jgi:predicted Zn-dependent protease
MRRPRSRKWLLAFSLAIAIPAFATDSKKNPQEIGQRDVSKGINFYSLEKELALGRQLAVEVERQARLVDDPILTEYINRVGQNLVRNSDVRIPVSIKVIESDQLNAFALPGGYVFVNSGLIRVAQTEAELAGAIAHEIAHVAARHATRQQSRETLVNVGTIPLVLMGGWVGYAVRQGAGLGIPLGFLSFSRGFETEADLLGLQYLDKAGYDPTAALDLFERIEAIELRAPGTMAKVFSSHPMTTDRIRETQKNIQQILEPKDEYVVNTSEFNEMRSRLVQAHLRRKREAANEPEKPTLQRAPQDKIDPSTGEKPTQRRADHFN